MDTLVSIIGYAATAFFGGLFGWLFTRKKYNVEVDGAKVQNFDQAITAYRNMYEDMIEDLKAQVKELKDENGELKQELAENRKQILTLTNFVLANAVQSSTQGAPTLDDIRDIIK